MRRLLLGLCLCAALAAAAPAGAGAAFGFNHFDVELTDSEGELAPAGSHPFALTASFGTNTQDEGGLPVVEGQLRDFVLSQVRGLVADSTAYPTCSALQFLLDECPLESAVGITGNSTSEVGNWLVSPVYNLAPPPGVLARFGFGIDTTDILVDAGLSTSPPYIPFAASRNTPQMVSVYANKTQIWGEPSDPAHDHVRGPCGNYIVKLPTLDIPGFEFEGAGPSCEPASRNPRPFLTMPTTCEEPLESSFEALSWAGETDSGSVLTHGPSGEPEALGGCEELGLKAAISAQPTNHEASGPSGLNFELQVKDEGLTSLGGRAGSHIRDVRVTFPEGMTANPSVAEGLAVCSEAELANEALGSLPGTGCPQASKIGSIEVRSPLVSETIGGALYQATPHANQAGDALIAFYMVLRNAKQGILIKLPVRVDPDPETGQLIATTTEAPQVPFSSFRLRLREGARSPLIVPPLCRKYETTARLTPWSGGDEVTASSSFEVTAGPNGGACPPGGTPPFEPGFEAGAINNAAGAYSPFAMRLTRRDGDQDLVRFDATLPPGVVGKLAGVERCAESAIAAAKAKSGSEELASPSCPAGSRIGSVMGGAGAGSQLTYVSGKIYLAGPHGGAPLSAVAIVPAVAGPFDVGNVVYRQALRVDPRTAQVSADGAASDPLPHILAGIPLAVRDVQVHIDRPGFTLNPTGCDPSATRADIWGGGADPFSILDNSPIARAARYQAAGCGALGFAPRLGLRLLGSTRRGGFPALRAVYRPRAGDANVSRIALRFPRSAFVEQGHFRTICTRVQFAAGEGHGSHCPKGSIYGHARAFTPLLEEPLEGPVFLRSSDNELPDAVFALKGIVDFEVVVRVDSAQGALRTTVVSAPDVPVSRVIVNMQGGRKGLIVNSRNLCASENRALARLAAHNAKRRTLRPLARARCKR